MGTHEKHLAVKIRDVQGELKNEFTLSALKDGKAGNAAEPAPEIAPDETPELPPELAPDVISEFTSEPEFIPEPGLDEGGSLQRDGE
jgi:hypothetical protein